MRLIVGGVLVALALTGCGQAQGQDAAGAGRPSASPSEESTSLGNGVTRSPSPGMTRRSGKATAPPASVSAVRPVKVTLLRSGGVAGVRDELVVATSGTWTYTTRGDTETGRLSRSLTTKLHRLANDSRLAAEAKKGKPGFGDQCPDSFQYRLTAGDVAVTQRGCGDQPERPVYQDIVKLLTDHTAAF